MQEKKNTPRTNTKQNVKCKMGNAKSCAYLAVMVAFAQVINFLDLIGKLSELRNHKVVGKCLLDQHNIFFDATVNKILCNARRKTLYVMYAHALSWILSFVA